MKALPITDNKNPLTVLKGLVANELDQVDELIYSLIISKISLIPEISEHTISSGGKRLRPILTLASAKMCGFTGMSAVALAACVEFIHTATLLHDDVVDKSELRRGAATANNLWGNKESILVGDFLLGKAFYLMGAAKSLEVYSILSNAAVVISEGEVMQLAATGNIDDATNNYLKIIEAKTAELFAASCQVGGVIAQRSDVEVQALRDYGMNLGIAFQIIDDALDYSSSEKKMGKNIGDDFRERKVTLPLILAYEKGNSEEKKFWERTINEGKQDDSDVKAAIAIMNKYNILPQVHQRAREYTVPARNALAVFPDSDIKSALLDVLDFAVEREF